MKVYKSTHSLSHYDFVAERSKALCYAHSLSGVGSNATEVTFYVTSIIFHPSPSKTKSYVGKIN